MCDGPKGMPGPYCASTELELLTHLIGELERVDRLGVRAFGADGTNPTVPVDVFVVGQAEKALKNYEALLCQNLNQLISPGFFNAYRPQQTCDPLY